MHCSGLREQEEGQLGQSLQCQLRCHKVWCPQVHIPFFHLQRTPTTFVSRAEREAQAALQLPPVAVSRRFCRGQAGSCCQSTACTGLMGQLYFLGIGCWRKPTFGPHSRLASRCQLSAQSRRSRMQRPRQATSGKLLYESLRMLRWQAPKPSAWGAQGGTRRTQEILAGSGPGVALGAAWRRAASTSRGFSGDAIGVPIARRQKCAGLNCVKVAFFV